MAMTIIRHSSRNTQGEQHVAVVLTQLVPFEAVFQMYTVHNSGSTTLDVEHKHSSEANAIAEFDSVTA